MHQALPPRGSLAASATTRPTQLPGAVLTYVQEGKGSWHGLKATRKEFSRGTGSYHPPDPRGAGQGLGGWWAGWRAGSPRANISSPVLALSEPTVFSTKPGLHLARGPHSLRCEDRLHSSHHISIWYTFLVDLLVVPC